jgi:hypothetical protein
MGAPKKTDAKRPPIKKNRRVRGEDGPDSARVVPALSERERKMLCGMYAAGLNYEQCAKCMGMSVDTLERMKREDPKLSADLDKAREQKRLHAYHASYMRAFPKSAKEKADSSLAVFLLKAHYGLREPPRQIQLGGGGCADAADPNKLGPVELAHAVAGMIDGINPADVVGALAKYYDQKPTKKDNEDA